MPQCRRLVRADAVARRRHRRRAGPARGRRRRSRIPGRPFTGGPRRAPPTQVVERARLLGPARGGLGETTAAAPRVHRLRRPATPRAAAGRTAGGRPDVDVGRAAVWATAGPRRRRGRQGGEPGAPGRHPRRRSRLLRLDERRKALLFRRFRPRCRCRLRGTAGRRRRRAGGIPARCAGPPRSGSARTCPPAPGRVWLRITGYGTDGRIGERVAFGDDAAVAGGLVGYDGAGPVFCR